jgi:hypothetical protein
MQMLLGAVQGGYNLQRSLRFRASASARLNRAFSSGNQVLWTWSSWVKRGTLGTYQVLFGVQVDGNTVGTIGFDSDKLAVINKVGGSTGGAATTNAVFRDPSAWYHIVVAYNGNGAAATDKFKIYVNSVLQTFSSTENYSTGNGYINSNVSHGIGRRDTLNDAYFDGYLTEVNFIDGQALTPASFGSTNATTGVWQPAPYTGTYGTNGFYLPFTDNSALTTSSNVGLGRDYSGNGNYWTTNNISITAGVTYDSMTDVPTLTSATASNYCVGNPLSVGANTSLSNGNLSGTLTGSGGWAGTIGGLTSGKWYYEATVTANSGNSMWVGFLSDVYTLNNNAWAFSTQVALYANDGRNGNNAAYGATWTTNDVIGIALDISTSSGSVTFYKNGVSQGVMFSSLTSSAVWRPLISGGGTGTTIAMNFGQRPFSYTPPTGYASLNTFNLPTATIVKGNTVMDATLYTGNGSTQTITNAAGFQPDLVWVKTRSSGSFGHALFDSVRGAPRRLASNLTEAENTTGSFGQVSSFNSNGFTVAAGSSNFGETGANALTYVGWQWQAGQGTTSSNTAGSITSTVSVNASAGFSVVTYTGTGSAATIGHGLGVAPKMIIAKSRSNAGGDSGIWVVYHASLTSASYFLYLNQTDGQTLATTVWNATAPTSTVFSVGSASGSGTASTHVAYCWSEIDGFSKFGRYTGNGSTDGPFVYLGFRPKYLLIKLATGVPSGFGDWRILDSARNTFNVVNTALSANSAAADNTGTAFNTDFLSNGFKLRSSYNDVNLNGQTLIYAAFAENPFKNSLAR